MAEWDIPQLKALAASVADEFGIDRNLFAAIIKQESNWDWKAVSVDGAAGLGQMTPIAALDVGLDKVPLDPVGNLRASAAYFSQQLRRFKGNVELALAAYNAGPTIVSKTGGVPNYPETKDYISRIVKNYRGETAEVKQTPEPKLAKDEPEMKIEGQSWTDEELTKMFPPDYSEPAAPPPAAPDQSRYILGGQQ